MDLWVVAAATGAGYLAKYLQNSVGEKEELSGSLSQIWDQTLPFCRLVRKKGLEFGDVFPGRGDDVTDGNYDISDILTLTSLRENVGETSENMDFFYVSDVLHELESNQLKWDGLLRSRRAHGFSIEALSPLESHLATGLNKEKIVKEGFIFSSPPSPNIAFAGPLMVNQIINRDTSDSIGELLNGGDDQYPLEEKNELLGSCLSRQSGLVELPRTRKHKVGKGQLSIAGSGGTLLSQGPLDGIVLFFAGITIGITSSIMVNKKELDNMNAQLKQKENLIQDLHDEIEMRDGITLKEVSNEDNQSSEFTNHFSDWELVVLSSKHDLEESIKHSSKKLNDQDVDNPELMSKIEAELEAELEKLDLNITSSGLDDHVELDPDFEVDVVQGDLKIHMPWPADASPLESDNDASGGLTNHTISSNYIVSPWELSVCLHKLIESRLEARIEELEQALRNSRKRYSMEWLRIISSRELESGEIGSSSTPVTHTYEVDDIDPSLVTSLSGEALNAYNEAYEEIIRMTDSDEKTP